jgi:hypothetical protein
MPIDSSSFAGDRRARRRSPYSERNRPPFSLADFFPRLFRNVTIFRGVTFSLNSSDVKIAEQQQVRVISVMKSGKDVWRRRGDLTNAQCSMLNAQCSMLNSKILIRGAAE